MNSSLFEENEDKSIFIFKNKDLMMSALDVLPKENLLDIIYNKNIY